jgi:iron complex transport system substrate-binding protein
MDETVRPLNMPSCANFATRRKLYSIAAMLMLVLVFAKTGEPRLLRDQAGRTVSVPDNPLRVVSLAPSITEIIFALGESGRLKGVTQHCDFPEAAKSLPKVGSYVHLDLERIVALKPDLCIAVRDGNPENVVTELEALGIPVYAVDPRNLDTAVDTVLEVGQLLDATTKAQRLAIEMRARIERVTERVAKTRLRPRVFFQIGAAPIVSAGNNTVISELIVAAGGQNLAEGPTSYPRFSMEQVLALQPEIVIITSMTKEVDLQQMSAEWRKYEGLPAVRDNRIFVVEADLFDRVTPRLIDGLETLAGIIHPELFR